MRRSLSASLLALSLASALGCGATGLAPHALAPRLDAVFAVSDALAPVVITYRTRAQLGALQAAGVDIEGVDVAHKRLRSVLAREDFAAIAALGVTITRDSRPLRNSYDSKYKTYPQTVNDLRSMAAAHPELCETADLGDSWQKVQKIADRDIVGLHIGKKGAGKPVVLFAGCHHARELATPEVVLNMAHHLLDGYGKDPEITGLVDTRDIWLVPMVNPDGHAEAEKGGDQRKNMNNVTGGKRRIGVDLNRNYGGPQWSIVGCSTQAESDTFCGKTGFSEPEVQAMRDLMRRTKPVYLLTFHSYSNMVLWPWGYTDAPPPDGRLAIVGKKLGELSGYEAGQSGPALYPTAGDDTDWAFNELHTLAYTVEVGSYSDGFDPPYSTVAKYWKENLPMMMLTLKTADDPKTAGGPEMSATRGVAGAEYFVGEPGVPGRGQVMAPGRAPVVTGDRRLVWSHARDTRGNWGPWSITWSR